ncbi:pancreatic secretory granule membrane major glycoprotein GP2-like isoform X2 [Hyla sarda]|uniref:pancreatic secretory granule membrane major glycoprotein GP2-like isoform X2 n=1 Tax=Hyla sarda TaxID=327740 RepID=UPI0024C27866|nr:pancreatic secretory granule membrane major glycoprotein GP2-like isoform X2 [Hyla sarda]
MGDRKSGTSMDQEVPIFQRGLQEKGEGTYPSPTIDCTGGQMSAYISKCWLEINGYNTTNIRLQNSTCVATRKIVNGAAMMIVHTPLTSTYCGNSVNTNSTYITYSNRLHIFAKTWPTATKQDVTLNFSCIFPLFLTIKLNFTVSPIVGATQITIPGTFAALTVNMVIYTDAEFTKLLTENDRVYLESTLYVSLIIPSLEVNTFKIKALDIYASASESGPTYYLLEKGCPSTGITADLMSVLNNGNSSEARFAMKVFQISGSSTVNLSAKVKICTDDCQTNCTTNVKSSSNDDNTAIVKVFLTADEQFDHNSANCFIVSWQLNLLLSLVLLVKLM